MQNSIKYVHTNLIARDWKKLSRFYIDIFGCKPTYPERNLSGEWLDKITLLDNAKIQGIHLNLPGYVDAPTLEIFEYFNSNEINEELQFLNAPGFGHIAFHVDNVEELLDKIIEHGGELFGEVVRKEYTELGSVLTVTYVKDPEGNFIELQNWSKG